MQTVRQGRKVRSGKLLCFHLIQLYNSLSYTAKTNMVPLFLFLMQLVAVEKVEPRAGWSNLTGQS